MRPLRDAAESDCACPPNASPAKPNRARIGWVTGFLLLLSIAVFAVPAGALPTSGMALLPAQAGMPAPAPFHAIAAQPASSRIIETGTPIPGETDSSTGISSSNVLPVITGYQNSTTPVSTGASTAPVTTSTVPEPEYAVGTAAALQAAEHGYDSQKPLPAAPVPAGYTVPTGKFSGFVNDSTDRQGISGAPVVVYSTTLCPASTCMPVTTANNGSFTIVCAAPGGPGSDDSIQIIDANWYTDNFTNAVCAAGVTTWVGTIFLVRDGAAVGVIKSDVKDSDVSGVFVQAETRNRAVFAFPTATTGFNGSFEIAVPPEPSIVTFTPPVGYYATFNYTNATPGLGVRDYPPPPWLGGVNMGTIYLEHETLVSAQIYSSKTEQATGVFAAMVGCSAIGNGCGSQGITIESGDTVKTWVTPGSDYFEVYADGFMETYTPAQYIPEEPPGTVYSIGKVYVVPQGSFNVKDLWNTPDGGSAPPWGTPSDTGIYATVCSEDGYFTSSAVLGQILGTYNMTSDDCNSYGCNFSFGTASDQMGAPPLRSIVRVYPDVNRFCSPYGPTWPVPGYTPTWENFTYVNITAGEYLGQVDVNFTPGDYVAGHVYGVGYGQPAGHAPEGCWTVASSSTDNANWGTLEAYSFDPCVATADSYAPCAIHGLPTATTGSFCLAVAPGNSKLTVADSGSTYGYASNWTWIHTPDYCCRVITGGPGYPALLQNATSNEVQSINITSNLGEVYGWTIQADTGSTPISQFTISICPALALVAATCEYGFGQNGTFYNMLALAGTDTVQITSAGYSMNEVFVNVTAGGNTSAGTIPLYGLGTLSGRVLSEGNPVYDANIYYCTIVTASACYSGSGNPLGATGHTGTTGQFNGTVPGGWLPGATYVVSISASGYTSDWTFGNASSFGFTTLPTMNLLPIGTNTSGSSSGSGTSGANTTSVAGVWVTGRLVDNLTGLGVYVPAGGGINVCAYGGTCLPVGDGSNTEGWFNTSVTGGLWNLTVSIDGYDYAVFGINATGTGWVDLGLLYLTPQNWVAGQVAINPWPSITLGTGGSSSPFGHGYAPEALAEGCNYAKTVCVSSLPVSSNGTYNVTVPEGNQSSVKFVPSGTGYGGAVAGGFSSNATLTNSSSPWTTIATPSLMDIFGILTGKVWDNDSINDSANPNFPGPAWGFDYPTVSAQESGNVTAGITETGDGGGVFVFEMPQGTGVTNLFVTALDTSDNIYSARVHSPIISGNETDGNVTLYQTRFGWLETTFVSSLTNASIADVGANAIGYLNGVEYSTAENGNFAGYLNMTAVPSRYVNITAGAPDFNTTVFTAWVNASATSYAYGENHSLNHTLPSYGFALSDSLNYSDAAPPITSYPAAVVVDSTNGYGLSGATVTVSSSDPVTPPGGASVGGTNWAGQFYSDAPIGGADSFTVSEPAYLTNTTTVKIHTGNFLIFSKVNLTGDAVVAGLVTAYPSGLAVPQATVEACDTVKGVQYCVQGETNDSGIFWLAEAPGAITLTISQTNYVDNTSIVQGCPDCWVWAGDLVLNEYATVGGFVRGLPSGLPVAGANVSLCSTLGQPTGPCSASTVTTSPYGQFTVSDAPGSYILAVNDTNYNSSYLPLALSPGETTTVGTLFLDAFGSVTGTVYEAGTFQPIGGATVEGCNVWSLGSCANPVTTAANGTYTFSGPPGRYTVTASASDYYPADVNVTVIAGASTEAYPIELDPIGTNAMLSITGTVLGELNSTATVPLADATVSADVLNGTQWVSAYTAPTTANGSFNLQVAFGVYNLVAYDQVGGWVAGVKVGFRAYDDMPGTDFVLQPQTYTVSGTVLDAISGAKVPGVAIYDTEVVGGVPTLADQLTTTDAAGLYSVQLTNGSHTLSTQKASVGTLTYGATLFTVVVNSAPQSDVNVSIAPPLVTVTGRVVDASTGLALAGATVVIQGEIEPGAPYSRSFTTDPSGAFQVTLYEGSYTASATYGSYHPAQVTFTAAPPTTAITLSLQPIAPSGVSASSTPGWEIWAAGGVAAAAILIAALAAGRPFRRATPAGTASVAPAPKD